MSGIAEEKSIAVNELLEAGWRIGNMAGAIEYIEPRTNMTFFLHEASKLMAKHKDGGTRPIAAKTGEFVHGELYNRFGQPHARVSETVKRNAGYWTTESLSVWFLTTKECEQFLSQVGHSFKKRRRHSTPDSTNNRTTHIE